jgi:shikimate 5-dehydrogenase
VRGRRDRALDRFINTVVNDGGRLRGYNTDGRGRSRPPRGRLRSPGRRVVVLVSVGARARSR